MIFHLPSVMQQRLKKVQVFTSYESRDHVQRHHATFIAMRLIGRRWVMRGFMLIISVLKIPRQMAPVERISSFFNSQLCRSVFPLYVQYLSILSYCNILINLTN